MGNRRHNGGHGFHPSSRKRSTKKKLSRIWKKSVDQTKKTLQHLRVPVPNRYYNVNGRRDDGSSRTKNVTRPSCSRPYSGVVGPQKNSEMPSSLKTNNGLESLQKDTKSSSRLKPRSSSPKSNNDLVSSQKNIEFSKSNKDLTLRRDNVEKPRPSRLDSPISPHKNTNNPRLASLRPDNGRASPPKNIEMRTPYSSRPNIDMVSPLKEVENSSPSSNPNDGFIPLQKNIKRFASGLSRLQDRFSSGNLPFIGLNDDLNSVFSISKKSLPSLVVLNSSNAKQTMSGEVQNGDFSMAKEASNSSLGLKGKQVKQDLQPRLGLNFVPSFDKSRSSRQPVEASRMSNNMVQNANHNRLGSRKRNINLVNDKSKSKMIEPLLEENLDLHEDDGNEVENSRPKKMMEHIGYEDEDRNDGDQNLASHQSAVASFMGYSVERNANHNQLDSRKQNVALTDDGRGDDDKYKSKMTKPLLEEKLDSHEDDDNEVENGSQKKTSRRPIGYGEEYHDNGDQNLASRQRVMASFMSNNLEQNANHDQLDSRKQNTAPANDEGDDDRSRGKMAESLLEEKLDSHDDDDNEVENCRLKKRRKLIWYEGEDDDDDDDGGQNLAGVENGTAMITQKTVVKETNVFNPSVSESFKLQHYGSLPIDEPIWSGIIKTCSKEYVALDAHLSTKYCEIVCKLSRSLQPVVEVTKLSRMEAWPRSFEVSRPTDSDIALYFLPHKMRQDADLDQLVKEVVEDDMVLLAVVDEAEMLIFPSILLPEQHQTFQGRPYLWAAFRPRAHKFPRVEEQGHGIGLCAQEEEMVKQPASHGGVGEKRHIVAGLNMGVGPEAPEEAEGQGMEQEHIPAEGQSMEQVHVPAEGQGMEQEQSSAQPNAPGPVEGAAGATSAPTMPAATSANYGQTHSSLGAPTGALFGFVAQLTPRFEQLIQEMRREGAVMIAVRGEMIAPSSF